MNGFLDLLSAVVVSSGNGSGPENKAVQVLVEEAAKRTGRSWAHARELPQDGQPAIVVGSKQQLRAIMQPFAEQVPEAERLQPEGYVIKVLHNGSAETVCIIGADARGVLFGVGKFLRKALLGNSVARFDAGSCFVSSPCYPIRGHQLGYRPKTNAYDAWTLEQYDQYIRELALFGANSIELLPPRTDDDATGPLMKADPLEMMIALSALIDSYGLDVWIWYPNMADHVDDPQTRQSELAERDEIFRQLKRIDAVFIPGSDPGAMHPDPLFVWAEEVKRLLSRHHPGAKLWLSPQVMDGEPKVWLDAFYRQVNKEPDWLGGIVFGPHVDELLPDFRAKILAKYPIRRYEDITHNFHCQYPVVDWDAAYALTLGRECYNPRPVAEKHIHNVFASCAQGNISYSEGINDDVNKFVWSDQDWDPQTPVLETLRDFARLFVGFEYAEGVAQGLMALEENWHGPLLANDKVEVTLQQWQEMEETAPAQVLHDNYRFQMGLIRAYYDAYTRRRLIYETELEYKAKDALRAATRTGSLSALEQAEAILLRARTEPVAEDYKQRCHELADDLFRNIGSQLTVERHQAIATDRGAFLDTIDSPLNNADFLLTGCRRIRAYTGEEERLRGIRELLGRTSPGPGGFYDNFGSHGSGKRVLAGLGWERDPGYLQSPRVAHAVYMTALTEQQKTASGGIPLAWVSHINAMTDTPITLRYDNLDPASRYTLRVAFIGDTSSIAHPRDTWIGITANDRYAIANDVLIAQGIATSFEASVPQEANADGTVELTFRRERGFKRVNIAEIWLIRRD
ncbi:MAG: hypothetical protein J7639_20700 [Paenibacillaceae bacterium]|nr:hypothetical protein [Paenibacillaceae bacterium]